MFLVGRAVKLEKKIETYMFSSHSVAGGDGHLLEC